MRFQFSKWRDNPEPWLFLCADDVVAHIVRVTGVKASFVWNRLKEGYLYKDEATGLHYCLDTTARCRGVGEVRFKYRRKSPLPQLEPLRQLCYCVDQGARFKEGELEELITNFEV